MKNLLVLTFTLLSSTYSFADTRVGKDFCLKFTKDSVEKTFDARTFSSVNLRGKYQEFSYDKDVDAYIQKAGTEATDSMKKLCTSKGENVTIEDMSHDLRFECIRACAVGKESFKKPLISSEFHHNVKVGKYLDYCSELCAIPDNELDNMLTGVELAAKNQAPDCTGAVADSSRTKSKPITSDFDKINSVTKSKKASGK